MSLGRVNALLGIRVHIGRKEGSNHNFANNAASFIGAYEEEYWYSVGGGRCGRKRARIIRLRKSCKILWTRERCCERLLEEDDDNDRIISINVVFFDL